MKQNLPKIIGAIAILGIAAFLFSWLDNKESIGWPGYIEGEFVSAALPEGGLLESLDVERGQSIAAGVNLYSLDNIAEKSDVSAAASALARARAERDNLLKGLRDSEIEALLSQKEQALAEQELARLTLLRREELLVSNNTSEQAVDEARATYERATGRVEELEAQLVTAKLPAREDEVAAANARIQQAEAAFTRAEWQLERRTATAPNDALVFDTFFEVGEFIPKGQAVVSLLPPENIKIRFYVPEAALGSLAPGDAVNVACDGCGGVIAAKITFISPEAEFTPPVIYSEDARQKLVFLVEAKPDRAEAMRLKPGQPVDVSRP